MSNSYNSVALCTLQNWQASDSWHIPPSRLCRWRWRSIPERRDTTTARLFLPSVHCESVTGAKMADNREEISELVEKQGICQLVSPFIRCYLVAIRRSDIAESRVSSRWRVDARVKLLRDTRRASPQLHVARDRKARVARTCRSRIVREETALANPVNMRESSCKVVRNVLARLAKPR